MTIDIDRYVDIEAGVGAGAAGASSGGAGFNPGSLGKALYLALDPLNRDSLTLDDQGFLTAFLDTAGNRSFTPPNQAGSPLYDPTGFNGFPGLVFDGVNDYLRWVGALNIPAPFTVWAIVNTQDLPNTGTKVLIDYGDGQINTTFSLRSAGGGGNTYRYLYMRVPRQDAVATINNDNPANPYFGYCLVRADVENGLAGSPRHQLYLNDLPGVDNNILPILMATSTTWIGANANTTSPSVFSKMTLGGLWFTAPLGHDTDEANAMEAFMRARLI